jgi:poly(ADP-ribose) glycohydrolase ARH3
VYRRKIEEALLLLEGKPDEHEVVKRLGNTVEAYNFVPTAICCFLTKLLKLQRKGCLCRKPRRRPRHHRGRDGRYKRCISRLKRHTHEWLSKLEKRDCIEKLAEDLWKLKIRCS